MPTLRNAFLLNFLIREYLLGLILKELLRNVISAWSLRCWSNLRMWILILVAFTFRFFPEFIICRKLWFIGDEESLRQERFNLPSARFQADFFEGSKIDLWSNTFDYKSQWEFQILTFSHRLQPYILTNHFWKEISKIWYSHILPFVFTINFLKLHKVYLKYIFWMVTDNKKRP